MNLEELKALATSPPFDYMAINKETGYVTYFDLFDVVNGQVMDGGAPGRYCNLSDCNLYASTGYDEVYAGHLVVDDYPDGGIYYFVVFWDELRGAWFIQDLMTGEKCHLFAMIHSLDIENRKLCIIGHIDGDVPEEVKEMLR